MAKRVKNKKNIKDFSFSEGSPSSKLLIAVTAKNPGQKKALKTISENQVTFLYGCPGTGKSHCAVGWGVQEMMKGNFDKLVFTRPYVEAGEKLGFLPGGSDHKFAPFVMPLYEVVSDYLTQEEIKNLIEEKKIIIYPLAYMRGITFKNSYVVADECQNATVQQMRMMLTRIGQGTKIVCTGDVEQSDLGSKLNGLADAINGLQGINNLGFCELGYESCVREKIVSDIDQRYKESSNSFTHFMKIRENNKQNGAANTEQSSCSRSIESEIMD